MKNVINLVKYYFPWELEKQIGEFVHYYNHERYHEPLNNLTPTDVYTGRSINILNKREEIKQKTLLSRCNYILKNREAENVCN